MRYGHGPTGFIWSDIGGPVMRRCSKDDVEAIYRLELEAFKAEDVYSVELIKFLCALCRDHSYVLYMDGELAGYIITCIEGGEAHVISIAVSPRWRRRGIASALLCTALMLLAEGRVSRVFLEVRASNTPAISLYRKAGMRIVETMKAYYGDGEDGYRLELTEPEVARGFCLKAVGTAADP